MELKDVYKEVKNILDSEATIKKDIKILEDEIREEYADIKGFKNKKGETDKGRVKTSELKAAMNTILNEDTKYEEKIEHYEIYKVDIRNGLNDKGESFPIDKAKQVFRKNETLVNIKNDLKDLEIEVSAIDELDIDKETFDIIKALAKDEIKTNDPDNKDKDKSQKQLKIEEIKKKIGI